jgi:hypothetical protein
LNELDINLNLNLNLNSNIKTNSNYEIEIENINNDTFGKLFGDFDFFMEETFNENNELKKRFGLFEEKIKQYEEDHPKRMKRNEQIIEDLKTENKILK